MTDITAMLLVLSAFAYESFQFSTSSTQHFYHVTDVVLQFAIFSLACMLAARGSTAPGGVRAAAEPNCVGSRPPGRDAATRSA